MAWFHIGFPALMIVAPALFTLLWCLWTGVRGTRPLLLATLAVLLGFGASAYVANPAHPAALHELGDGRVLAAAPRVRDAAHATSEPGLAGRCRTGRRSSPRRVELFQAARSSGPLGAWAVILAAVTLIAAGDRPLVLAQPGWLSLGILLFLPRWLRALVVGAGAAGRGRSRTGSPSGTRCSGTTARAHDVLADRDAWRSSSPGGWYALPTRDRGLGRRARRVRRWACGVHFMGTWADAQRYLLRRELVRRGSAAVT